MAKHVSHKFAWVIKDFSSLQGEKCDSVPVQIGDCKWRLVTYPKGRAGYFSLFLEVADFDPLPIEWRRYVKFRLSVAKQVSEESSVMKETHRWFDQKYPLWGFPTLIPLSKLHDKNEGFIVNGDLMIIAEVDILQVIGIAAKSEETTALKWLKVETLSSSSERHQESVVEFRAKNKHLKTACMNVLLSLTQTLCQTPQDLSVDDLLEAEKTLAYMKDTGFEVDWLQKKLKEVKEKKMKD